jgi:formate dehydrogenase subunit gamma
VSHPQQLLPHGRILRYEFHERLTHWIAGFSYLYLLITGLGFYSPWLQWLLVVMGGGQTSRILHPWIGLIFAAAVLYMYVLWAGQMHMTDTDRAWWNAVGLYARNEDDKMPPAGRYNAGQKLLFWGFFVFGLLLLLSGLVLWFPEYIPWSLRFLRYTAVIVHVGSALITIGLFMLHVYMGVFAERGAFGSVIRGDVSSEFARRYHPGWYEEVTGAPASTPRR